MGIQGLHQFVKPVTQTNANISMFRGKKVGVDAMCWMHRGAISCAFELVMGKETTKFVNFFASMVSVLLFNDIEPIIVFDGLSMPAKKEESAMRHQSREKNRQEALAIMEEQGERAKNSREAYAKCVQSIHVTHEMIQRVMEMLIMMDVKYIVAPYEADAQLAYMCRGNEIECVISEDSDLLVYGCPLTFCKMDNHGNGDLIDINNVFGAELRQKESGERSENTGVEADEENNENENENENEEQKQIPECHDKPTAKSKKAPKAPKDDHFQLMRSWTDEQFELLCILSGCDYSKHDKHIKGLGLMTAVKLISNYKTKDKMLRTMYSEKKWTNKFPFPVDKYLSEIEKVECAFRHHIVVDVRNLEQVFFSKITGQPLPEDINLSEICGMQNRDRRYVRQMTLGRLNIKTKPPEPCYPCNLLTPSEKNEVHRVCDLANMRLRDKESESRIKDMCDPNKIVVKYLGEFEKPVDADTPFVKTIVEEKITMVVDDIVTPQDAAHHEGILAFKEIFKEEALKASLQKQNEINAQKEVEKSTNNKRMGKTQSAFQAACGSTAVPSSVPPPFNGSMHAWGGAGTVPAPVFSSQKPPHETPQGVHVMPTNECTSASNLPYAHNVTTTPTTTVPGHNDASVTLSTTSFPMTPTIPGNYNNGTMPTSANNPMAFNPSSGQSPCTIQTPMSTASTNASSMPHTSASSTSSSAGTPQWNFSSPYQPGTQFPQPPCSTPYTPPMVPSGPSQVGAFTPSMVPPTTPSLPGALNISTPQGGPSYSIQPPPGHEIRLMPAPDGSFQVSFIPVSPPAVPHGATGAAAPEKRAHSEEERAKTAPVRRKRSEDPETVVSSSRRRKSVRLCGGDEREGVSETTTAANAAGEKRKKVALFHSRRSTGQAKVFRAETEEETRNVNCGIIGFDPQGSRKVTTTNEGTKAAQQPKTSSATDLIKQDESRRREKRHLTSEMEAQSRLAPKGRTENPTGEVKSPRTGVWHRSW